MKEELLRTIQILPAHVNFTILSFNTNLAFLDDPPHLLLATPDNKARASKWVKELKAVGETSTDWAFDGAFEKLKEFDTIYLLSDGQPYRSGAHLPQEKILESIKAANRFLKCRIHTIGFFQAGRNLQNFLRALAGQHDGTYTALK